MIVYLLTALLAASVGNSSARPQGGLVTLVKVANRGNNKCFTTPTVQDACPPVECIVDSISIDGRTNDEKQVKLQFKPKNKPGSSQCSQFKKFTADKLNIAPNCTGKGGNCRKTRFASVSNARDAIFNADIIGGKNNCRAKLCMFFVDDSIKRGSRISVNKNKFKGCLAKKDECNSCKRQITIPLPAEWCLKSRAALLTKISKKQKLGKQLVRTKGRVNKTGLYSAELEQEVEAKIRKGCKLSNSTPTPWKTACNKFGLDLIADFGTFVKHNNARLNPAVTGLISSIKAAKRAGDTVTHFAVAAFDACPALDGSQGPVVMGMTPVTLSKGDGRNGVVAVACGQKASSGSRYTTLTRVP